MDEVHETHPPLLRPRLQLLPVGEGVGELAEAHTQRAQLVRGQGGGGGQRAEGLWGSWGCFGQLYGQQLELLDWKWEKRRQGRIF